MSKLKSGSWLKIVTKVKCSFLIILSVLVAYQASPVAIAQTSQLEEEATEPLKINKIVVLGSTAFSAPELAEVTSPYLGKPLSFEIAQEIATAISNLYRQGGYVGSQAYPAIQNLSYYADTLTIQVIEGKLEKLEILGLVRVREDYVQERLGQAATPPLNANRIKEALQLLQLNPLFKTVKAELAAGSLPQLSVLKVQLIEAPAFTVGVQANNYEQQNIGENQAVTFLSSRNVSGAGDKFTIQWSFTEGANKVYTDYQRPINAQNSTVRLQFQNTSSEIILSPLNQLDISGKYRKIALELRHPLTQSLKGGFSLFVIVDLQESQNFLLGESFAFIPGIADGSYNVKTIRFSQSWIYRSLDSAFIASSQFNFGFNSFKPTANDFGLDDQFSSWQGSFQYSHKLTESLLLFTKLDLQLSGDTLLPAEQNFLGGISTVKGYELAYRRGDSGLAAIGELRWKASDNVEFISFINLGTVWNNELPILHPNTLTSIGIGGQWQVIKPLMIKVDYAQPLIEAQPERNLNILFQFRHDF